MNILVINAGSSSLKYQLIDMTDESVIAKGNAERIGIEGSNLKQTSGKGTIEIKRPLQNHTDAIAAVVEALTDAEKGVIKDMSSISAVGHRVVHGGDRFNASAIIDDAVIAAVEDNVLLSPLHNPANLQGIAACKTLMPDTPMVAVFDTAFHQTMPPEAYIYALPYSYYTDLKVRRYGFHGTSHRFVSQRALELLGKKEGDESKIVICHLGNGSSISAVKNGKCVDTTMGLTPLEGLPMGTRSGDVDPAAIEYIMNRLEIKDISKVISILNKESGLYGVSGVSSDMRDLAAASEGGNERAKLAIAILCYKIRKYIGSYAAALGGLDAVVFTAGIGENDSSIRAQALEGLGFLGLSLDEEKNKATRSDADVATADSKARILVVSTNEELAIAKDTLALIR